MVCEGKTMTRKPITLDCAQRSDAWYAARLGIPTASGFCRLVTVEGKRRKGLTPQRYIDELVYDRLTGVPSDTFEGFSMRRGLELEPHARCWYELATSRKVRKVGFVFGDDSRKWGCSPDGITEGGGIEIKCLSRSEFVASISGRIKEDYAIQAQGEMWVCGADWWDLITYTEEDGKAIGHVQRIERDEAMHAAFEEVVPEVAEIAELATEIVRANIGKWGGVTLRQIQEALGPEWVRWDPNSDGATVNMEDI
jgi:hypothetical protein